MRLLIAIIFFVAAIHLAQAAKDPVLYGTAGYFYPPREGGFPYQWFDVIRNFNTNTSTNATIDVIYAYGGDIEYLNDYPYAPQKNVYFDEINAEAAEAYGKLTGVKGVVAVIDGRMDGVQIQKDYKYKVFEDEVYPDLSLIDDEKLDDLAKATAQLYCAYDFLAGLQIDLEPFTGKWKTNTATYLKALAKYMRTSEEYGCVSPVWPQGRSVSYFTFAENVMGYDLVEGLGDNGYFVFSGYDLYAGRYDFMYHTIAQFKEYLQKEIAAIKEVIGTKGRFTLALPVAASSHEYEQYIPGEHCGPACTPYTSGIKMVDYTNAFFDVLEADPLFRVKEGGQFAGLALWSWSFVESYPSMRGFNNTFQPPYPSADALAVLKQRLPNLM